MQKRDAASEDEHESEQGEEEGFHEGMGVMGGLWPDLKSVIRIQGSTLISLSQSSDSACHLSHEDPL